MKKLKYRYNCTSPNSLSELNYIVDNMRTITYKTFRKHVNSEDFNRLKQILGYTKELGIKFHEDFTITFHKSITPDKQIVYLFCHSCIEYIFY